MYKVLCDGALMCDSRIEELALINPVVKLEENKAGSFSFKIPPQHPFYDAIKRRTSIVEVYLDEELLFCGICTKDKLDFYKQRNIECEGELTFLNDSVQRPAQYKGMTVRGLLEAYIANHNAQVDDFKKFTVGMVTVTDSNDYISCYTNMESTMKALKEDLVDDLGGFFRIRHEDGVRYLDYLAESPNTNTQIIKVGKNLMDFTTNIDSTDIATAIIPLGCRLEESPVEGLEVRLTIADVNNGLDYVYSQEAVDTYGWIYKTVEWDGVTTAEALKRKGEQYLSDIQFENMVIQAKAVDMHLTDKEVEQFKISDQIRVVSAPHGLNRYFRLTKQTINLNNPEQNTITLGKDEKLSLSAKTNQQNEEIKKAIESIVPASTILKSAVANASELIKNSMNGYITTVTNEDGSPRELLIMDTNSIETATKVWRWNINGLGYSSTGYNGEYSLAMTMDGHFVADALTVDGLEVGKNVTMGPDAVISWNQVVGGTNMLRNTKAFDANWTGRATVTSGQNDPNGGTEAVLVTGTSASDSCLYQENVFTEAGNYVVSFWAKGSEDFTLSLYGGNGKIGSVDLTTEWQKFAVPFSVSDGFSIAGFFFGGWRTWADTGKLLYLYHPMLESGDVDSSWTPSPYDVVSEEQVTEIARNSVTTENIKGTTIEGKVFKGGSLEIGDEEGDYHAKIDEAGKLTCTGAELTGSFKTITHGGTEEVEVDGNTISFKHVVDGIAETHTKIYGYDEKLRILAKKRITFGVYVPEYPDAETECIGFDYSDVNNPSAEFTCKTRLVYVTYMYAEYIDVDEAHIDTLYTASGTVSQSDRNAKNSIKPLDIETTSDFIYSLKPSKYRYNNGTSDRFHHGLIAQEVKEAMGDDDWGVYIENADGKKGIRYEELIADLIATVQSQNTRIKALEERLGVQNE